MACDWWRRNSPQTYCARKLAGHGLTVKRERACHIVRAIVTLVSQSDPLLLPSPMKLRKVTQHPQRQFSNSVATIGAGGQPLPGLVWAIRFHLDGTSEELSVDQPIADQDDGWLWLHFNLTDTRACRFLEASTNLPKAARQMLVATDEHQQLHTDETCVYGVFADLVCGLGGATEEIGFLRFAMTENLLVSSRRNMLNAVEAARGHCEAVSRWFRLLQLLSRSLNTWSMPSTNMLRISLANLTVSKRGSSRSE